VLVDAFSPSVVVDVVSREAEAGTPLRLVGVLVTHHHLDHSGGNDELKKLIGAGGPVEGSNGKIVTSGTVPFVGGSSTGQGVDLVLPKARSGAYPIQLPYDLMYTRVPCHTQDSVLIHVRDAGAEAVFTGDTHFIGGCGRFFEGTGAEMDAALSTIASFKPDTFLYPGHEYSVANLKFGAKVEPDNAALAAKAVEFQRLRDEGKPTVPSLVSDELAINVFFRLLEPQVLSFLKLTKDTPRADIMTALREAKNNG
jgi:hydroxyacylglutathione hydrolase